jgi:hypothetical protein
VNFTLTLRTGAFACTDCLLEGKIFQVKVIQKNERVFCVTVHIFCKSLRAAKIIKLQEFYAVLCHEN